MRDARTKPHATEKSGNFKLTHYLNWESRRGAPNRAAERIASVKLASRSSLANPSLTKSRGCDSAEKRANLVDLNGRRAASARPLVRCCNHDWRASQARICDAADGTAVAPIALLAQLCAVRDYADRRFRVGLADVLVGILAMTREPGPQCRAPEPHHADAVAAATPGGPTVPNKSRPPPAPHMPHPPEETNTVSGPPRLRVASPAPLPCVVGSAIG